MFPQKLCPTFLLSLFHQQPTTPIITINPNIEELLIEGILTMQLSDDAIGYELLGSILIGTS